VKAAVVTRWGELEVMDVPEPKIGPYEALVKINVCSICNGTDLKIVSGHLPWVEEGELPVILGHESVGEVVEIGAKVKNFRVGDRVFRPGGPTQGFGSGWGGFAEYGRVTDMKAHAEDPDAPAVVHGAKPMLDVIPREVDDEDAAIAITMKETLSWLWKLGLKPLSSVVVTGVGPVGLSFLENCRLLGAGKVISLGRRDEAAERAFAFGADHYVNVNKCDAAEAVRELTGGGADFAVDAVGSYEVMALLKASLKAGGTLGVYGTVDHTAEPDREALNSLFLGPPHDASIAFVLAEESIANDYVMACIKRGALQPKKHITHRLPLERIHEGLELVRSREAIKVIIET